MPSAIGQLSQQKFGPPESPDVSMAYIAMVARVVGEITKDEQLMQIAAAMSDQA